MLPAVSILLEQEPSPPPPRPETLPDMVRQYCRALETAAREGCTSAVLSVWNWSDCPWTPLSGAYAVLKTAVDFLYDHPEIRCLEIRCAGESCYRDYRFQWNMWFAEHKEEGPKTVTKL